MYCLTHMVHFTSCSEQGPRFILVYFTKFTAVFRAECVPVLFWCISNVQRCTKVHEGVRRCTKVGRAEYAPVLLVIPAWMEAIGTCAPHPIYSTLYSSCILVCFGVFLVCFIALHVYYLFWSKCLFLPSLWCTILSIHSDHIFVKEEPCLTKNAH